jgi:hypothetical protein
LSVVDGTDRGAGMGNRVEEHRPEVKAPDLSELQELVIGVVVAAIVKDVRTELAASATNVGVGE